MAEIKAVIFDFDGVICDSEMLHYEAFNEVLRDHDISIIEEEYYLSYLGLSDKDFFCQLVDEGRLDIKNESIPDLLEKKKQAFEKIAETKAVVIDGISEFLNLLSNNNIHMAICSGAILPEIENILKKANIGHHFQTIVSAEQVENGKPAPDGFLMALERLNKINKSDIKPSECLVIEDSHWGLEAASAAGMKSVAVTNSYPAEQLKLADLIVENLSHLTIDTLKSIN